MSDFQSLMSLDPLKHTKDPDTVGEVIAILRSYRHQFNAGNLKAGSTKPKTTKDKEVLSLMDAVNKEIDL